MAFVFISGVLVGSAMNTFLNRYQVSFNQKSGGKNKEPKDRDANKNKEPKDRDGGKNNESKDWIRSDDYLTDRGRSPRTDTDPGHFHIQ